MNPCINILPGPWLILRILIRCVFSVILCKICYQIMIASISKNVVVTIQANGSYASCELWLLFQISRHARGSEKTKCYV